jgi:glycosyltransferase involved in cell wall biosynthesis/nucleotide-binding universal stress UspA family protein
MEYGLSKTKPKARRGLPPSLFRKVMVPVIAGQGCESAMAIARAVAGDGTIELVGLISIPPEASLSTAAAEAGPLRKILRDLASDGHTYRVDKVHATHHPWRELSRIIGQSRPSLLVLEWPRHFEALRRTPAEVFARPPCNLAAVAGNISEHPEKMLVALRGGPYAELSLRLSLSVAKSCQTQITSLHMGAPGAAPAYDAPFRGLERVLRSLPEIEHRTIETDDPVQGILDAAGEYDLVVLGASATRLRRENSIGPVADRILRESDTGVIVVRTRHPAPRGFAGEEVGQTAISVLVDKWFAENTYSADEFDDLVSLADAKKRQGLTVSVALPALNEEATVGTVIEAIRGALVDTVPLVDEIVLVDSNSTDRTREIAAGLGLPVYIHQETLPAYGARAGKGEALWKSLYLTRGDIIVWIDTDIVNIHPRFVYGLLGPLLSRPDIQLVKGYYRRPLRVGDKLQLEGGGRVTELTARPLLNLFYPELSGIVQPLAGEYAGRRAALEQIPFASGYGVEIGLLIDIFDKFGLRALAQVDLRERIHHNQTLEALSKMSFAIIQTVLTKLERRSGRALMEEVNRTMKLIRYEPGHIFLEVQEIAERERPAMIELPEYRERLG